MSDRRPARVRSRRRILLAMDLNLAGDRRLGIAQYAHEAGWILESRLMAFLQAGKHEEYLASFKFDGVISIARASEPILCAIVANADVPVVDLSQQNRALHLPRVFPDHRLVGSIGAAHLGSLGLRRLVFYAHTIDNPFSAMRLDGFREAARRHGADVAELWWDESFPMPPGQTRVRWLAERLRSFEMPIGVMGSNDTVATDVLDAAEVAGLRVPADVAVIGADNEPILAELGPIPLSSVDIGRPRVGYEAAALLGRMIDGASAPEGPLYVPPAGVVRRHSTEMLAVADPEVAEVLRFIERHFREPITVADVAGSTFLSRRQLQERFTAALGHGMNDEIARQRLELCKQLLTRTNHKLSSIARMAGFMDADRMSRNFKRVTGMTPNDYRKAYHFAPLSGEQPK